MLRVDSTLKAAEVCKAAGGAELQGDGLTRRGRVYLPDMISSLLGLRVGS